MGLSNRLSSSCRTLLVVVFSLLLVSAQGVKAQTNPTGSGNPAATADQNQNTNNAQTNADQSGKTTTVPDAIRGKLIASNWYPIVISLLFGLLLLGFAATIIRVILRSKSSFRSPLGLPDGSLRAMLAFMLVAFLGFYVYASILSLSDFRLPESLLGIVATVIGFYFGSRSGEGTTAAAEQTGVVDGTVVDNAGSPAGGATVELSRTGAKPLKKAADATGNFKFDNVPVGDYQIQASLTNHNPSDPSPVKVTAGETQTVSLKLK